MIIKDLTEVILRSGSEFTTFDRADLRAVHVNTDLDAVARADCSCGGGDTDARSHIDYQSSARVTAEDNSIIRTALLWVEAFQVASGGAYNRDPDSDGGLFDGGSEEHNGSTDAARSFYWEATVILLGEPNPVLVVDQNGVVVAKTRNVHVRAYDPVTNTYSALLAVGDTVSAGWWIVVGDLIYDEGGKIHFQANDVGGLGPNSQILGNAGEVQIKHTWDSVLLQNASNRRFVINDIDAVLLETNPVMEVSVGSVPDVPGTFNLSVVEPAVDPNVILMLVSVNAWLRALVASEGGAPQTFDFDIIHKFAPTHIEILNVAGGTASDIWLDGDIESPIGLTEIRNVRGSIFADNANDLDGIESTGVDANLVSIFSIPGADTDYELIRTNRFQIDSDTGSIGRQAGPGVPRVPVAVELIRFRHIDPEYCGATPVPCLFEVQLQADAAIDNVLDITGNDRSLTVAASSLAWQIDRIIAGDDVDVVVNDSIQGTDAPSVNGLQVFLYTPDNGRGEPAAGPAIGGWPQTFQYHFRPDIPVVDYAAILRAFGITTRSKVTSTYTFGDAGATYGDLVAGDNINVCHVPSRDYTSAADFATANLHPCDTRDPSTLDYSLAAATTTVHFVAFLDEDASLPYPAPFNNNDDGIGIDVPQVFLSTNGNITATELVGDFHVGHVHSSNGDVTLYSPMRFLDADGLPTIDITGVNITLFAGTLGGIGGIGLSTDFLEIDTSVLDPTWDAGSDGVLKAYDTDSDDAQTQGIFLDEIVGDLPLWEVFTAGNSSLATGNVSARTLDGSILNAKLDDTDNIRGQSVDLDANGGSIGLQSKDVMVDSNRAPPFECDNLNCGNNSNGTSDGKLATAGDDVALEATGDIYLTETDAYLRLVLAHALTGNIRLTVRETSQTDEDLYLIKNGSARFAESNTRAPNSDIDAPRVIPNGTIFAESGSVELRVGDDVTLHQFSQILADLSIDIRGDYGNADTGGAPGEYGTSMILRGLIIADCNVAAGGLGDEPMGVCTPSINNPVAGRQTHVWGDSDVDIFELGDPSGLDTTQPGTKTTWGSDGYIFLGSKTTIHGNATLTSNTADGEDEITVWYLQTMDVLTSPTGLQTSGNGAGHTLNLDGQGETDHYSIYTNGSHGSIRNYVINVLDTGPANQGVDELDVYGYDNAAAQFNGQNGGADDIWLLRALTCIDNESPFALNAGVPSTCASPTETADHPAFIALLAGNNNPDGGIGLYRDRVQSNEPSYLVQRINYDRALNGRITVFGLGGNDAFYVDDTQATMTLDGGAGNDSFQIGQIFGTQRDSQSAPDGGALLPADTFPALVPTTRGWLSPGTHAPLLATGGTGNDRFIVYSNQAEIQLNGDDHNDLFIVRAFAIAAVCDTNADNFVSPNNAANGCGLTDVDYRPAGGVFPKDIDDGLDNGQCFIGTYLGQAGYIRYDNNGDNVCNNADAHITYNHDVGSNVDLDNTMWQDDMIPLDANGVAVPVIGLGFSTNRPLDIRAGGGEDEVQYNVNAPVNVDGGTGFDKLVVLGTEFADDFAITDKAIYGAGLNVKYTTIEVLEIDGLEGDDQFFVLSTAFGVAYRVIGGLGSDQISVAGDVTADIVTRELEGISGAVDHIVRSDDPRYDGIVVDGVPYNLATPDAGVVVIKELGTSTSVREGTTTGPIKEINHYTVELSHAPTAEVYVTVSAAHSPDEEARDTFDNPTGFGLTDGMADTIWLCVDTAPYGDQCNSMADFQRHYVRNGVVVNEAGRAVVLTFAWTNWNTPQRVYIRAYDDPRSEGDRVVVVQHSVIAQDKIADAEFHGAAVRQVNVRVYDNDTPGVYVTHVESPAINPTSPEAVACVANALDCTLDDRGIVIEGPPSQQLTDQVLVQLAKDPGAGVTITVRITMDADSQRILQIDDAAAELALGARWTKFTAPDGGTYYELTFLGGAGGNWDIPVRLILQARNNSDPGDPTTAVINGGQGGIITSSYKFPNLRSGAQRTDVLVYDDETAQVVTIPTGTDTVVVKCGNTLCSVPGLTDGYWIRLTSQPRLPAPNTPPYTPTDVKIAITPDGLVDVVSIGGVAITPADYVAIGGDIPSRLFLGNLSFSGSTVTRVNGSDTGSFLEEGLAAGMRVKFAGCTNPPVGYYTVQSVAANGKSFTVTTPLIGCGGTLTDTSINVLTRRGIWDGSATVGPAVLGDDLLLHFRLTRAGGGWLTDGVLEGMWVEICDEDGDCVRAKIQNIRGSAPTFDSELEFRPDTYDDFTALADGTSFTVVRIAAQATFSGVAAAANAWYKLQFVELEADLGYYQPIVRQGVKNFPASQHLLTRLRGPLAVEGGVTGADRSLELGLKLPGEQDGPLFAIATQAPESKQIDVLNVYGDGSVAHHWGVMTSTTLRGLGMAKDLDFGPSYGGGEGEQETFGEPQIFPGGISFGSVSFVDGEYETDGGKSTIEVLNLFLGSGNDRLDIQGTLQPDVPVKLKGTITLGTAVTYPGFAAPPAGAYQLTRSSPFDWKAQGFLIGQPVTITNQPGRTFKVVGFADSNPMDTTDNTVMYLQLISGAAPTTGTSPIGNPPTVVAQDVPVTVTIPVVISGGAAGGTVTRSTGDWAADGFVVGQLVRIANIAGQWRLVAISADGKTLTLDRGDVLPSVAAPTSLNVFVPGPHGGLSAVHGGGNTPIQNVFEMVRALPAGPTAIPGAALTVTRGDGLNWAFNGNLPGSGYYAGDPYLHAYQHVQLVGENFTRMILGFGDVNCLSIGITDPFPNCGKGSILILGGPDTAYLLPTTPVALTLGTSLTDVRVAQPVKIQVTTPVRVRTSSLTRTDGISWQSAGFKVGMQVRISGFAGPFTISGLSGNVMTIANVAWTPTQHLNAAGVVIPDAVSLTLTAWDEVRQSGDIMIGGDTITVCNRAADALLFKISADPDGVIDDPVRCDQTHTAGPGSPLVVYGDTTQDGVWYSGAPGDNLGMEFGPKPFDPFTHIPDGENEDDEWIFGLANPYDYSGNDIIDASGLFADVLPANLPTVGFTAYGGLGDDLISGSQAGDHLAGGSGDDEIRGQRGVDHIYGDSGVNVDVLTRALDIATVNRSPKPTVTGAGFIPNGTTLTPITGGVTGIVDDLLVAGYDLIYGEGTAGLGLGTFVLNANGLPQSAYDDVVFGDHGAIDQDVADPNEPDQRLQKIQTTTLASILRIRSVNLDKGADDVIFGGLGRDVLVGGAGNDMADGDEADDILFGDAVWFDRTIGDWTSGRFQTLCGTLLYSRSDMTIGAANLANLCSGLPGAYATPTENNSGQLLVDGTPRAYRDPDGAPWWAEYDVTELFHDVDSDTGIKWAATFGNDYLAGGQAHDLLFGQLGDDVMQGDGGIDGLGADGTKNGFKRWIDDRSQAYHVGASRTPLGCVGAPGSMVCDYTGLLVVVPSREAATDGEDYIEGNAGNDVIFGGLGQDDILGGSSDFFSLGTPFDGNPDNDTPEKRPDGLAAPSLAYLPGDDRGADILFGGAGSQIGINNQTSGTPSVPGLDGGILADGTVPANMDARDADTIVGDNGRIIRIVGINHVDGIAGIGTGQTTEAQAASNYVKFAYDQFGGTAAGTQRLIVRGVHLLDYTVGGPDYLPQNFDLGAGSDCNGSQTQPTCSIVLNTDLGAWRNTSFPTPAGPTPPQTGGRDEVHGETGDDTVYGGADHDVVYGDAQNDDIIGGWGNDWISGGTGSDGILGDDGRIFTSRNTGCSAASTNVCTEFAEPLYGVLKLRTVDPDTKTSQGDVLNEFIYTPGQVQTAVINVPNELVKSVDLTVYTLGPDTNQSQNHVANQPTYDANNSDDIIFGGWGGDWIHGGAGDDAISGAEAIGAGQAGFATGGFAQHFDADGDPIGLEYIDFAHPWNPGDVLHFGADTNPWHANNHNELRLGEFYLYDEYDPRREIRFDASGATWGCTSYSPSGHTCTGSPNPTLFPNKFFLNNEDLTGNYYVGADGKGACIAVDNQGLCIGWKTNQATDGNDAIFGDLGNDWSVGGTGQDTIWAGWGNDLSNADDDLHSGCVTAQPNGTCTVPGDTWLNDVPDGVNSSFQDRVYGGAGLDILIGNTGGDRLIDWVCEFNTYLVPFAPFGIATVSRQNAPQLPEFLYALSRSQGVDLTRWTDEGTEQERNGEPFGELGLIRQSDHGHWQTQTGGPTDPQAGNIPGGRRDTLRGADFNDGSMQGFATDSGVFAVQQGILRVTAASSSGDAVAVWYSDAYQSVYYELSAKISMDKPTGGWKANAYVIFDYFGPMDFKFAGIDQSTNKVVIGQRASWGWAALAWGSVPGGVKAGTYYDLNVVINGLVVTVTINGKNALSHTFPPRMLGGDQVALNKGLVGFGSDQARGLFDNIALTVISPAITVDRIDYFEGSGILDVTGVTGTWPASTTSGRLEGSAVGGQASALIGIALPTPTGPAVPTFDELAYVELESTFRALGTTGFMFDWYSATDYKFAALDVAGQRVVIGHVVGTTRVVDKVIARPLTSGTDYVLNIVLKATVVTVTLNGQVLASFTYNAPLTDGRQGVFGLGSGTVVSLADYRVKTDDPVYTGSPPAAPAVRISDATVTEGAAGTTKTVTLTVTRDQAGSALSLNWSVDTLLANGATFGSDFTGAVSGVITFAAGATTATITFTIVGDSAKETDEAFIVRLQPAPSVNLADAQGLVTIKNDD